LPTEHTDYTETDEARGVGVSGPVNRLEQEGRGEREGSGQLPEVDPVRWTAGT